jgi:hypothetical protein
VRIRRRHALACLATIALADYAILRRNPRWIVIGLFDEPAHLATAALVAGRLDPAFMLGSVLPDLDHVPLAFQDVQPGDPRPKTHSIYAVLAAALVSRPLAAGMLTHFARDIALEPGIPLFGGRHVKVPYGAYAVIVLATAYSRSRPY